jgi:hypothetical protein
MTFNQQHSSALKTFLRVIIFTKKILGIHKVQKSQFPFQPNKNTLECFEWKRITLVDIDRLWRISGKLDASFPEQLSHFSHSIESNLNKNMTKTFIPRGQFLTQDAIDRQWVISRNVHPAFGRQLCHFAVAIETTVVNANSN